MIKRFKKFLERKSIERQLLKERRHLKKRIAELEKAPDFGEGYSPDVESDESEEWGNQLGLKEVLKDRENKINHALSRLAKGTYGECLKCGKPISEKLLRANPLAELCQDCLKNG